MMRVRKLWGVRNDERRKAERQEETPPAHHSVTHHGARVALQQSPTLRMGKQTIPQPQVFVKSHRKERLILLDAPQKRGLN